MTTQIVTPENDRMLSKTELSERWGVSVKTLENWRHAGKGPKCIAIGKPRYLLSEVVRWEQENMTTGKLHENRFPEGASMEGVRARQKKAEAQ